MENVNHEKPKKLESIILGIIIACTTGTAFLLTSQAIYNTKKWEDITQKSEFVYNDRNYRKYAFIDLDKNGEYEEIYSKTLFAYRGIGAYVINKVEMEKKNIEGIKKKMYEKSE
jgi:hypothetical protein